MQEKHTKRRIAIITAATLGLLAALYLGGLLGQVNAGHRDWLSPDGAGGNTAMPAPDLSPQACIPNAFSPDGLKATMLVIGAAGAVALYLKLNGRKDKGEYDERNFKRAREGTYGTAAWMSGKEMKKVLEVTSPQAATGTILGGKNGKVICLPHGTNLNKHLFVCGDTAR